MASRQNVTKGKGEANVPGSAVGTMLARAFKAAGRRNNGLLFGCVNWRAICVLWSYRSKNSDTGGCNIGHLREKLEKKT
jgi:hypothetical protein